MSERAWGFKSPLAHTPRTGPGSGLVPFVVPGCSPRSRTRRKEPQMVGVNALVLVLQLVVAWGRFGPYAF